MLDTPQPAGKSPGHRNSGVHSRSIVGGTPAYRSEFIADDVPASRADFDDWVSRTDAILACYSGTGFSAELSAVAASNPGVVLVDLERLYQTWSARVFP